MITLESKEFATALKTVSKVVPNRPSHPILGNILIEVSDNETCTLTGFDLSTSIRVRATCISDEKQTFTLPAQLLNSICSKLPQGELTLSTEITEESVKATLKSGSGKYELQGVPAADYPPLPSIEGKTGEIKADSLNKALKIRSFASTDETKQVLTGVRMSEVDNQLEFAATDGHRLSVVDIGEFNLPENITVPAKTLGTLSHILSNVGKDDVVSFQIHDGMVSFQVNDYSLTTRVLQGDYPEYQKLVPEGFVGKVSVDCEELTRAINIASLVGNKNDLVRLNFEDNHCKVTNESEKGSVEEQTEIAIEDDPPEQICFAADYINEALKHIPSSSAKLCMNGNDQPAVLFPESDDNLLHLVMPVKIRD